MPLRDKELEAESRDEAPVEGGEALPGSERQVVQPSNVPVACPGASPLVALFSKVTSAVIKPCSRSARTRPAATRPGCYLSW
jgi:hypothetical protein